MIEHPAIGQRVVYAQPYHARSQEHEYGTVTAVHQDYVFVHFDGDNLAKACRRENLYLPVSQPPETPDRSEP